MFAEILDTHLITSHRSFEKMYDISLCKFKKKQKKKNKTFMSSVFATFLIYFLPMFPLSIPWKNDEGVSYFRGVETEH